MQKLIAVLLFASLCALAAAQYGHGYNHKQPLEIKHQSYGGHGYGGYGGYGGHSTGHSVRYDIREQHGYGAKNLTFIFETLSVQ